VYVRFNGFRIAGREPVAALTPREKRDLEELFGMGSGYVLNFSNRSFQEFILDVTGLNIDDEAIGSSGTKANRLRHFWNTQPDHIVGTLLKSLLSM
jgi:hypothetical protein